jgi:hypothetical protein
MGYINHKWYRYPYYAAYTPTPSGKWEQDLTGKTKEIGNLQSPKG